MEIIEIGRRGVSRKGRRAKWMADGLKGGRKRNTSTIKSVITVEQVK